jgi:hypothetical protein
MVKKNTLGPKEVISPQLQQWFQNSAGPKLMLWQIIKQMGFKQLQVDDTMTYVP